MNSFTVDHPAPPTPCDRAPGDSAPSPVCPVAAVAPVPTPAVAVVPAVPTPAVAVVPAVPVVPAAPAPAARLRARMRARVPSPPAAPSPTPPCDLPPAPIHKNDSCEKCDHSPCLWDQHKEDVTQHVLFMCDESAANNIKRKLMYQHMSYIVNEGPMGKKRRKRHAECVECGIRELFQMKMESTWATWKGKCK